MLTVLQGHIARALLEGIALSVCDVIDCMEADLNQKVTEMRVDGGASNSEVLMQMQSSYLNRNVIRGKIGEGTALGSAFAAGKRIDGCWALLVLSSKLAVCVMA